MNVLLFPGQGTQHRGMGAELWQDYPELNDIASTLLGYSIKKLCLDDPDNDLRLTQYTQPAIFVVNAMHYYRWREQALEPQAALGHSLGEYGALLAAGCFDFETGLRLVQKRGLLMSQASAGGMAAVLGLSPEALRVMLDEQGLQDLSLVNFNSPTQTVIAGDSRVILAAEKKLSQLGVQCIVLNVSAAFHSPHMLPAQTAFSTFLKAFTFNDPVLSVIANATALPYGQNQVAALLSKQIASPVLWVDSIRYLMSQGDFTYTEMGATPNKPGSHVLGKLVDDIRRIETPRPYKTPARPVQVTEQKSSSGAQHLGSCIFRTRYGVKYAYVAGGMFRGISSPTLVKCMAQAGMLAYLGTAGMSLDAVEAAIQNLQAKLAPGEPYGLNVMNDSAAPNLDKALVALCLKYNVQNIEVSGFNTITAPLALFRVKGLHLDATGNVQSKHRILAKTGQLEVAEAFMSPVPAYIVQALLDEGLINADQAQMASCVSMSDDVCLQIDSAGLTARGHWSILFPAISQLRAAIVERYHYQDAITLGLAGGIGTPEAASCAFMMGADFILTGSINQSTVESGATDIVKSLLQNTTIHDTTYAPDGDMRQTDSQVQVLQKASLFPTRAIKIYALLSQFDCLEDIPEYERVKLERDFFKRSLADIWNDILYELKAQGRNQEITHAQTNAKVRMSFVLRWYWRYSLELASSNSKDDLANYQIHTSAALGAFNQHLKNTGFVAWQHRHVDQIALALMSETAQQLRTAYERLSIFNNTD